MLDVRSEAQDRMGSARQRLFNGGNPKAAFVSVGKARIVAVVR